MASIKTKRAYELPEESDGFRILVDRLWPRGLKKEDLHLDVWMKEVAPSAELRKWFNHEPGKWEEFKKNYAAALKFAPVVEELIALAQNHKSITLVYGAKDEEHNHAVVLKEFLENR